MERANGLERLKKDLKQEIKEILSGEMAILFGLPLFNLNENLNI